MRKIKSIFFLIIVPFLNVNGQDQEKIKFTGLFQTIVTINRDRYTEATFGKTELGVWLRPFDFLKVRMIGKVYKDFSIKPFDLYAAIIPFKNIEIKFGQFRSPFSYENTLAPFERSFIDESQSTKYLPTRDFGIGFDYKASKIEINSAIFNGEGLNKPDINYKKDWVIRLALTLPDNYLIGMSYYSGFSGPDSVLYQFNCINWHLIKKKKQHSYYNSELTLFQNNLISKTTGYFTWGYLYKINENRSYFVEPLARLEFEKFTKFPVKYFTTLGFNFLFDDNNTLKIQANLKTNLNSNKSLLFSFSLFYAFK